jgi:hypothetical protein
MAQAVPKGPLAARVLDWSLDEVRAGAIGHGVALVENAGTVAWHSHEGAGVRVSYHWLDERGNPIVWDGIRNALPHRVAPGEQARVELEVQGPMPPGRYRFSLDLIAEHRAWFAELGGAAVGGDVDVLPRIERRLAVLGADPGALDAQEEAVVPAEQAEAVAYLAPGVVPAPDWSQRVLDAHQAGYAIVGGSVGLETARLRGRGARGALAPWRPGSGRVPAFPHPLLCPSIVNGVVPDWVESVEGLPAVRPRRHEPWLEPALYDGRIAVTARLRSDRRPG